MGPGARRLGCVLGSSVGYGTWRLITVGSMLGIHRGDLPFPTVIRLSKRFLSLDATSPVTQMRLVDTDDPPTPCLSA